MMRDRNLTAHTYREAQAREIHGRIPADLAPMRELQRRLTTRIPGEHTPHLQHG